MEKIDEFFELVRIVESDNDDSKERDVLRIKGNKPKIIIDEKDA